MAHPHNGYSSTVSRSNCHQCGNNFSSKSSGTKSKNLAKSIFPILKYFPLKEIVEAVDSLYCGHPWDCVLVSLKARVHSSGNLLQTNA